MAGSVVGVSWMRMNDEKGVVGFERPIRQLIDGSVAQCRLLLLATRVDDVE